SEDVDVSEASKYAARYLQRLDRQNGLERKTAVRLLNSIIDSALQPLASPTDTSLSEMFLQIRRQLLADGRELVLLVEDFAVLSGIQGALLDAMIREGVRGSTDACIMRTALAVTAGYDFGRYDTVKTRAVYGWYVDESPVDNDDQMVGRICDYVGAYLNAARFGSEELKQRRSNTDEEQWPPYFGEDSEIEDGDRQQLNAFGRSPSGFPLFPFNEAAVRQLSDIHLRDADNQLRLNPRTIINHLLIRVLRDYRSAWIANDFPSKDFLGQHAHDLQASLQSELRNAEGNSRTRDRYLALLRYWGDCPNRLSEVLLPQQIYEAFGMRPLAAPSPISQTRFSGRNNEFATRNPGPSSDRQNRNSQPARETNYPGSVSQADSYQELAVTSEHPEEVRRWERILNDWTPTSKLLQKESNELRRMLADHVLGAIDWDSLYLCKLTAPEMKGWQENIFLPNAKGASNIEPAKAMCTICTNEEFATIDGRNKAILALYALARHEYYKTWDYPDAELDYARLHNLLDSLVPQATEWILAKKYRDFAGDPVPALVEHILLAARFLDVKTAHTSDGVSLLNVLFESPPNLESPQTDDEWSHLKYETAKHHRILQEELLARTAVRQGGAGTTHGVDCMQLLDAIRNYKSHQKSSSSTPIPDVAGSPDLNAAVTFVKQFSKKLTRAVRNQQTKHADIYQRCLNELGDEFDKSGLVSTLKDQILPEAERLGVLGRDLPRVVTLQAICEEFRSARVADTIKRLAAPERDDFGAQVSSLAQINDSALQAIDQFVSTMPPLLTALEKHLRTELVDGEEIVATARNLIEHTLDRMSEKLCVIEGQST
ncbi:MAG: protein DpdH, partial [Planctomycetaceae bacterium]